MPLDSACPNCGAREARVARSHGWKETVLEFIGVYQLRCKRCQTRYQGKIFSLSQVRYARCPKCYRTELSTWSEQYYNPTFRVRFKLRLGATPYRCEFCRCNFASFRACKERFSWRKYRRRPAADKHETDPGKEHSASLQA
jgi:transposase